MILEFQCHLTLINYEDDDKVKLILVGTSSIILFQTFIHIGVNIRLLPTTGMTLPFLSYGGSSIVSTSILSGIITGNLFRLENKLNFKKVLSSFKVFTKWDGPIIKTFSLCI